MNYTSLYWIIYCVRNITCIVAKTLAWILGLQLAILYGAAIVNDVPLIQLSGPGLRFAAVLAVVIFAPQFFDAALCRIATRYQNREK